jgi:ribose transport system ATP-binding protein
MSNEQLLLVEGVSKGFPGVQALQNVRFDLSAGEVHALVGENGAGKSTLMKVLSGIYKKDAGTIKFKGQNIDVSGPLEAQHLGISIIHQEINLMPDLTVAENIFIGREPRSIGKFFLNDRKLNSDAQALLDTLKLPLDPTQIVGGLTVAKQQMVEIAKALSYNSSVIIMDEPTSSLTPTETAALFEIIENLKKAGKGVIYISHRLEELSKISDRITVFRDGKYIDTLQTKDTNIAKIISLMIGRDVQVDLRPETNTATPEVVLKVEGLTSKKLLKDVSFDLKRGEILGFAGLMGAGRTEVALALVGKDPISSGKVEVNGKAVKISNPADAVAHGIGYLSEDRKRYGLLLNQNVDFNIILSSVKRYSNALGFFKSAESKKISEAAVKKLSIRTPSISQTAKNLSGGNQQKVVISKWLTRECDILIFDEPTRGIDVGAKDEIYKLLRDLAAQGKSIIMISSELPEVLRLSDRIVVMCEGRVTGIIDNKDADQNVIMQYATKYRN